MSLEWLGQEMDPSELLRRLPSCYSAEFDKCIGDFDANVPAERLSEYCRQFHPLYLSTVNTIWDAALESVPFCPAPTTSKRSALLPLAAAGVIGLFLGLVVR